MSSRCERSREVPKTPGRKEGCASSYAFLVPTAPWWFPNLRLGQASLGVAPLWSWSPGKGVTGRWTQGPGMQHSKIPNYSMQTTAFHQQSYMYSIHFTTLRSITDDLVYFLIYCLSSSQEEEVPGGQWPHLSRSPLQCLPQGHSLAHSNQEINVC